MYSPSEKLADHSRIWIYQSSRELTEEETAIAGNAAREFIDGWTAHNASLLSSFEIRYNRFLILMVDEKTAGASGCSIDKSVHFIKSLESKFGVSFFDRMTFAYRVNGRVEAAPAAKLAQLYTTGGIDESTIVFDNLIQSKGELSEKWEIPFGKSWHKKILVT